MWWFWWHWWCWICMVVASTMRHGAKDEKWEKILPTLVNSLNFLNQNMIGAKNWDQFHKKSRIFASKEIKFSVYIKQSNQSYSSSRFDIQSVFQCIYNLFSFLASVDPPRSLRSLGGSTSARTSNRLYIHFKTDCISNSSFHSFDCSVCIYTSSFILFDA